MISNYKEDSIIGDVFFGTMQNFKEVEKEFKGFKYRYIGFNQSYRDCSKFIIESPGSDIYNLYVSHR